MKLIKFQEQNISVPNEWSKPYYRTLEHEGLGKAMGILDESITTMPLTDTKKVDYELVILRDARGKEYRYYVNFEEASHVMPILDSIVQNQTKEIREQIKLAEYKAAVVSADLKYYRNLWFVKLHDRVRSFFKHL